MSELEKLIHQKKEIEERIRQLKETEIKVGDIRYSARTRKRYGEGNFIVYNISVFNAWGLENRLGQKGKYATILCGTDKEEFIKELAKIIDDLKKILTAISESEGEQ